MSSPYPSLRTVELPYPVTWDIKPPMGLQTALESHFKPLQTTHPGMIRFGKSSKFSPFQRFDHKWHLEEITDGVPQRSGPFSGKARAYKDSVGTDEIVDISGFCKITHLLDAYKMIQGNYPLSQHPGLPAPSKRSAKVYSKIHDPHNQAYVDGVACYMLSKFREADHSPHFSLFYGAYLAIAKKYYYNITEDFSDIRFDSWFWKKQKEGVFSLVALNGDIPLASDDPLIEAPDDLYSDDESSISTKSSSFSEFEVGDRFSEVSGGSLHSASISTSSEDSSDSYESDGPGKEYRFFALLSEFPTMLMFLESNTATMDSLLDSDCPHMDAKPGTQAWEDRWTAWLFQVIVALCQIQSLWAMTHNDLHSNNILWVPTDKEFLYYTTNDGRKWKVPTYGKLFRIIDFGRAIFTHNGTLCISDDYWPENEAGTQYNFGPFYSPKEPRAYPNPSFDLCRLSVSIIEALFLENPPADKEGGAIMSSEDGRVQKETVSELFNVMWSWLIDDDGRNVLWDTDQSERYPGFDLYCVIAQKVKGAVPREQLDRSIFSQFVCESSVVPEGEKVYSLFC
uniref:Protein kinase domain-containing protein n=1 Tax=viral metagenome TaxID=1070528 RepID=A0A6C0ANG0_9ZZZZ